MPKSKVFSGVIWASAQRFGTMIISFVTNIVLAWLLTPEDFGTIGMLLLFMALANTFVDSGLGSAIIQKKDANERDFSTVFYINFGMSLLVYLILFVCAPLIAKFYKINILCTLLRVEGLVLILHAFCIVQTSILRKKMDFKKLSICNLTGNIVGSVVAIIAAIYDMGVWSLAIRLLVVSAITSVLLWIMSEWKPILVFSRESFRELFNFGGFMLLSSIVYAISNNIQTLIIGKLFPPGVLGNYTQARQLRNIATESTSSVISQVLYPEFSNNQDNNNALAEKLNLSVSIISFLVVGLMACCILIAKPLILLLYGSKWIDCVLYFQIMCVAGCFIALQDININIVAAKGRSKILFYCNVIKIFIFCFLIFAGAKINGIIGLIIAINIYTLLAYILFSLLSMHYLQESVWNQYKRLASPILLASSTFFFVYFICHHIQLHSYFQSIVLNSCIFFATYWGIASLSNNTGVKYINMKIYNKTKKSQS